MDVPFFGAERIGDTIWMIIESGAKVLDAMSKEISMKKALLLSALVAGVSTQAMAADIYVAPEAPPAAPVEEVVAMPGWTGGYIGVQGGWNWTDAKFDFGATSASRDFSGGSVGKFAGYNWQFDNNVVVGLEGDIGYTWNKKNFDGNNAGTDWNGSVRGRLGYAFDNALVYGTGGWTVARGFFDGPTGDTKRKAMQGYTLGAGVDYKFNNNMFARAEYRFNDYGSEKIKGVDVDFKQHAVMLGVGYKF